jgi:hypothetical protein
MILIYIYTIILNVAYHNIASCTYTHLPTFHTIPYPAEWSVAITKLYDVPST